MVIDKLLETLIGAKRGYEIFENPTEKELEEIVSYAKRKEVRAIYNLSKGKMYIWEMGHVHGFVIRDYFLDEDPNDLVKMIIDFSNGKITYQDVNPNSKKMFQEALKHDNYLKNFKPFKNKFITINETLIKRDKYKEHDIGVSDYYAQNKRFMKTLENRHTGKQYIDKGYKQSIESSITPSMMAGYEYIGYYLANRIVEDYKLEGFTVPRVRGIVVGEEDALRLIMEKSTGKPVANFYVKGRTYLDKEDRLIRANRINVMAYPMYDIIGANDIHPGNMSMTASGKMQIFDFERLFDDDDKLIDKFLIDRLLYDYYSSKTEKVIVRAFFRNLLKLKGITPSVISAYVKEAIKGIEKALKNEDYKYEKILISKLSGLFIKSYAERISANVEHIREMAEFAEKSLKSNHIYLEEAKKFQIIGSLDESRYIDTEELAAKIYKKCIVGIMKKNNSFVRPFREYPELYNDFYQIAQKYKKQIPFFKKDVKEVKKGFLIRYRDDYKKEPYEIFASVYGFSMTLFPKFKNTMSDESKIEVIAHELMHVIQWLFNFEGIRYGEDADTIEKYYSDPTEIEAIGKDIVMIFRRKIKRGQIKDPTEAVRKLKGTKWRFFPKHEKERVKRKILSDLYYYNPVFKDNNKVKEQYEKVIGAGTGTTPKTP